ncbi:MAG: hypothetical protein H0W02_02300 [Ktedonobacteraceae bacterium]|nr:hypothetical protein [Ktedonobacteraceae bacterium]
MANLTRHNPFNEVVSLREAMDRLFEDSVISPRTALSRGTGSNLYETRGGLRAPGADAGRQAGRR